MPTPTKGRRLGGSSAHQRHILANLATALFEHGKITTTEAKARRLRPYAERLITFAKRGDLHARREVLTVVTDRGVVHTLFTEIGPRFATREGGYTRITKIGPRKGDNAPLAVIELVEEEAAATPSRRRRGAPRPGPGPPGPAQGRRAGHRRSRRRRTRPRRPSTRQRPRSTAESRGGAARGGASARGRRRPRTRPGEKTPRTRRGRGRGRRGRRRQPSDAHGAGHGGFRAVARRVDERRPGQRGSGGSPPGLHCPGPAGHRLRRHRVLRLGAPARPADGGHPGRRPDPGPRAGGAAALTVAGRTDAGVHARGQVAHADIPADRWADGGHTAVRRLARLLPPDVRVHRLTPAPPGFDARFSAIWRATPTGSATTWRGRPTGPPCHALVPQHARRRGHEPGGPALPGGTRFRRVLPPPRRRKHRPHAAAPGLDQAGAGRGRGDGGGGRVLPQHGPRTGRRAAQGRRRQQARRLARPGARGPGPGPGRAGGGPARALP